MKPIVFISHIAEEKEIAYALKQMLESSFLGFMEVFVASDPKSIPMGQRWLERIRDGLQHCVVEIVIVSPSSLERPWINFEAGAGWIRDIPVIPLCHSGTTPSNVPQPLNDLQGALATSEEQLRLLMPVLAKAIGCDVPKVDFSEFVNTVREYEHTSEELAAVSDPAPSYATDGLAGHELLTLVAIADETDSFENGVSLGSLVHVLRSSFRPFLAKLAVKSLERYGFVTTKLEQEYHDDGTYTAVTISNDGWNWLNANHSKLPPDLLAKLDQKTARVLEAPPSDGVPF